MPQYSVNNLTIDNVLGFIKNKEISIPEIQRPFVWKGDQIRDLIDSLYNGYPIGYHDLNEFIDYAKSKGATFVNVREGHRWIEPYLQNT
jgi:uncharacterized protein with ParB-like and HNH nuclease domain